MYGVNIENEMVFKNGSILSCFTHPTVERADGILNGTSVFRHAVTGDGTRTFFVDSNYHTNNLLIPGARGPDGLIRSLQHN